MTQITEEQRTVLEYAQKTLLDIAKVFEDKKSLETLVEYGIYRSSMSGWANHAAKVLDDVLHI